jgi:hypothetical protein
MPTAAKNTTRNEVVMMFSFGFCFHYNLRISRSVRMTQFLTRQLFLSFGAWRMSGDEEDGHFVLIPAVTVIVLGCSSVMLFFCTHTSCSREQLQRRIPA